MARYQAVRGTFDVLPTQMPYWHKVESTSRELAHRFGYREIRTPLFEEAELFTRGMGVMAGLIEKELWTFQDKYGQKLALRTDATTGVVRAYQQHKLYRNKLPLKVFYVAPVFLLGKEGDAPSRQSHQFGFEAIGSDNPAIDAEIIGLAASFCEEMGLEDVTIKMNSLGGKECRPLYLQKLKDYFGSNSGQLCSTCKRKYKANPDWVLSCEEDGCKALSQVAPTIYGMLTNGARDHFTRLREYIEEMELPVELDPRVVRDSEYYNSTVFEFVCQGKSLGFGGRYDSLVEKHGGKPTPAVGFAFCLEAVLELLDKQAKDTESLEFDVLLRPEGPESAKLLVPLLFTLRQRGISAELDYNFGNGRRNRDDPNEYSYLVTLDESNAFRGNAQIRNLEDKSTEKVPVQRLRNRVLHIAGVSSYEERDGSKSGRKKLKRGRRRSESGRDDKDDKRNDEDSDDSNNRSRNRSRRRGRRKDSREKSRDKKSDRKNDNRDKNDGRDKKDSKDSKDDSRSSNKRGKKKRSRNSNNDNNKSKKSRSSSRSSDNETKKEPEKAIVPVFGLGKSGPAPSASKDDKPKSKSSKSKNKSSKAAAAASGGGNLNWSILPD